jgi:hypothetical protein
VSEKRRELRGIGGIRGTQRKAEEKPEGALRRGAADERG